jgi:hypothetical protein
MNGMTKVLTLAAGVLTAASVGPAPVGAQDETVRLEGDRVAVWNLAGHVEVVRGNGAAVVVTVSRGGSDGARLEWTSGQIEGRNVLRILYPGDRVVYDGDDWSGNTTVRVRDDGTFGSGGDEVRVSSSGRGLEAWADLRIEVPAGKDVAVHQAVGAVEARGVEGELHLDTGSGRVDVADVTGRLGVDTGSGSVTLERIRGLAEVDTGSGSIRFEDLEGDRVRMDTGSGSVTGEGLVADAVEIDTGSGEVDVDGIDSPDVIVDTGSGSVELGILVDVARLEVDTGSVSVTVRLPEGLGAGIELDTGSGGIDLDFAVELSRMERTHVEGRIGDGNGRIQIDTGSGSIRLLRR